MTAPTRGESMWEYWHARAQRKRRAGLWPELKWWARPAREEGSE